jgi:hypothetical protein
MEGGGAADGFRGRFAVAKFVSRRQQIRICQGGGVWNVAPFCQPNLLTNASDHV